MYEQPKPRCPTLVSVAQAEEAIESTTPQQPLSTLFLRQAHGRIIAESVRAGCDLPPFEQSAMDGFAVRSIDLQSADPATPVVLELVGEIAAGNCSERALGPRQAMRIMTGAPLPPQADAVVMQEDASCTDRRVSLVRPVFAGQHVRHRGEDIAANSPLLVVGRSIGARETAALAASGCARVTVCQPVRVAVVVTGSELREAGQVLAPGAIYDSNSAMLEVLLRSPNVKTIAVQRCEDDPNRLAAVVEEQLGHADMLLVVGGVSVGRYDYGRSVLRQHAVQDVFWKVAQKPGKPLYYGVRDDVQVFGLPGNPVSAWLCFLRYVRPAIALRLRSQHPWPTRLSAIAGQAVRKRQQFTLFCRGRLRCASGKLHFSPSNQQGSHQIARLLEDEALAELPPGQDVVEAGSCVEVLRFAPGWLGDGALA